MLSNNSDSSYVYIDSICTVYIYEESENLTYTVAAHMLVTEFF